MQIDEFMIGAICSMCGIGVHFEAGRVACDGCDLPTDCCRCQVLESAASRRAIGRGLLALNPGSASSEAPPRRRR